ncbi:hypothetical protein KUCAC02_018056 [Chaenocephalus aceratus]|uniref:Uncharacterized protein n=1 Tax=Chaenocephalus aceratus TaxID=36190 RepID=A0ACB9W7A7_CHAAC|nr:hypothetical protein KUCAC02_018056 [Chaenocephalus aceratus]
MQVKPVPHHASRPEASRVCLKLSVNNSDQIDRFLCTLQMCISKEGRDINPESTCHKTPLFFKWLTRWVHDAQSRSSAMQNIQFIKCEVCYLNALTIVSVPGHFSSAGQVMYLHLQQADSINSLDPYMRVCSFGKRAPQVYNDTQTWREETLESEHSTNNSEKNQGFSDQSHPSCPPVSAACIESGLFNSNGTLLQSLNRGARWLRPQSKHGLGGQNAHRKLCPQTKFTGSLMVSWWTLCAHIVFAVFHGTLQCEQ